MRDQRMDALLRTHDGKFTMVEWWRRAEQAQASRGKRDLLRQFIQPGDLVFDVGANRGVMTLTFRQLAARVVAVEPLFSAAPHLVREFQWKFGKVDGVIAIANAVSDEIGTVTMSVHKNLPYLSSCDKPWMTESAHAKMYNDVACQRVQVRTTTLDALIERYGEPAFVKIDVEGYESTVIRGLTHPVQALSFEFHEDWLTDAAMVTGWLDVMGNYEYNYALDNRGRMIFDQFVSGSELFARLKTTLTKRGRGSWGDIYARRK